MTNTATTTATYITCSTCDRKISNSVGQCVQCLSTPIDVSTTFTVGELNGTAPGGRRFTMAHANDGVVVTIERYNATVIEGLNPIRTGSGWSVVGTFELFADEVADFAHKLGSIARNVEV